MSNEPDPEVFRYISAVLMQELAGEIIENLAGLDEVYWDLKVGVHTVVIHLQHDLGIMIHPAGLSNATDGETSLLDRAFEVLDRVAKHD